ncbi:glutamate-1-semialdehyde 2,1-aminomutase [Edaphobacter acidisoli]|uniref:Glutamate-1-semialdehyde 2,1-aminomutase n=1 Tax=Edaphobacter acidisoli TaxID=2040573 RepID=A0A916VZT6_9BACT|nr:aspartate aminotransferase family protein [Edaphobacter acidisoli]GGA54938.1 glutamate-1-semialdehyde 2,1-aminomutase [Edaphobacter acidisoli]
MLTYSTEDTLEKSRRFLPGGVASVNRIAEPDLIFVRGSGAHMWDSEGKRYIDYHAAFGPHILGHNDPHVNSSVARALEQHQSLYGSGTTSLEARLAEMICGCAPFIESVALLNTGSEATYQALRLARAATGRDHIIVMQGGYNGWHNDVACNLATPLAELGPRITGEYRFHPISAGIPAAHSQLVHPVNFNDLESVRLIAQQYPIAAIILEPILQNIGVVKPAPGYLQGLRKLATEAGFLLIFDEVKTGFRHSLGGYASLAGVAPDLAVYGKAIANGYPIAAVGGAKRFLDLFVHPDPARRVLLAGTYNGHPIPTAAAIATIERLRENDGEVYTRLEQMGEWLQTEIEAIAQHHGLPLLVERQGSAFCLYLMDHAPRDWHDLAAHHDFTRDKLLRMRLIQEGIYTFPVPAKQWSISAAHTQQDLEQTVRVLHNVLPSSIKP